MCGIAGIFRFEAAPREELLRVVDAMNYAQRFRGPDGSGAWANERVGLGCARLEISGDRLNGRQPLSDICGGVTVFNGEIYNFRDLHREAFGVPPACGASDGATLAALLARRGTAALHALRGPFALARYDPARQRLLLARDAVGKKPLYLARTGEGWAFASTAAALRCALGGLEIRTEAVVEYLVYRSVGGDQSAFRHVHQLPPGSWIELSPEGPCGRGRWWSAPSVNGASADPRRIHELLDDAVELRARPAAPVSVFLSGGLDSSIIAAALRRRHPEQEMHLLSVGYDVGGWQDERDRAHAMACHLGLESVQVELSAAEVPELMLQVATLTEDPIQDPVTLPTLCLARAARTLGKVVLTGDGSDEIWGGYERFHNPPARLDDYLSRTTIFQPDEIGLASPPESYLSGIDPPLAGVGDPLDRILRLEVANRMRNYHLARVDKITMGVGLEARCPFLDVRAVEEGLALPARCKRPGGTPKGLLLEAFAADLPAWLRERRKQPFSVPIEAWLRGPLRSFAHDVLRSSDTLSRSWIRPEPLLERMDRLETAADAAPRLWSLLQLETWHHALGNPARQETTR
jgi:asparagine synthase (glutamine-hydrolysing)